MHAQDAGGGAAMASSGAAAKRVGALTGFLLALLAVAGSVGLWRLDAESFREDAQALLQLRRLDAFLAASPDSAAPWALRAAATRWLEAERPETAAAHRAARTALTDALLRGLPGAQPLACGFFAGTVVEGKPAALDAAPAVDFAFMAIETPWLASAPGPLDERSTVARLLARLADLQAPADLRVAVGLDLPPPGPDPCAPGAPQPQSGSSDELREAMLVGDAVVVRFETGSDAPPQAQMQLTPREIVVAVPAMVETMRGPSAAALLSASGEGTLMTDLASLWSRPEAMARVARDYGFLPVDYAVSTAGASLVQGYAGAQVLGVRVTPRRLALAVAAAALALTWLLAMEARAALRRGARLREDEPEGLRAQLSGAPAGRLLLWAAVPAASILLAAPPDWAWIALSGLAAAQGLAATLWAGAADRRIGALAPPAGGVASSESRRDAP